MKTGKSATEDDMITAFLEAELHVPRHRGRYAPAMRTVNVADLPDGFLTRPEYAGLRQAVLSAARGWPDQDLFKDFPQDVNWHWATLEVVDLQDLDYIHYSYWDQLSHGSHKVIDGAKSVAEGKTIFDVPNDPFWEVATAVKAGKSFAPIVLLQSADGRYVVVEGHTRVTGFALAGVVPEHQQAIVGSYVGTSEWGRERKL